MSSPIPGNLVISGLNLFTGVHTPANAELITQSAPLTFTLASGGAAGNNVTLQFINTFPVGSPDATAFTVTGNTCTIDIYDSTTSAYRTQTAVAALTPTASTTSGGAVTVSGTSSAIAVTTIALPFSGGVSGSNPATISVTTVQGAVPAFMASDAFGLNPITTVTSSSSGAYSVFLYPGLYVIDGSVETVQATDVAISGLLTVARLATGIAGVSPTAVAGAGAGTVTAGPTISGSDSSGKFSLTPGTAVASETLVVVSFDTPYPSAPGSVTLSPANAATAALPVADQPYVSAITASGFTVTNNTTITGISGVPLSWYFTVA